MGLTGILSAIMARALSGSTMFRAGVSKAVRGCKSMHDFKQMAHSHPRGARLDAPSGGKGRNRRQNRQMPSAPVNQYRPSKLLWSHQFGGQISNAPPSDGPVNTSSTPVPKW